MASKNQKGLGKGVAALFGKETDMSQFRKPVGYVNKGIVTTQESGPVPAADIVRIPVELIEPNPFQPRMSFDNEALQELADSIRSLGLVQPITVRRRSSQKYQIISGERRFRACNMIGMDMIPAYIREANDQGMLEMAIVENIQRENLDPIEVAMSYQRLIDECNLTQEQMAQRVGKKRASVTNTLRLLKLPAKLQHDLKVGLLSVGHAKVLLGIEDTRMQESLCDKVIKDQLSVRQLEELIQNNMNEGKPKKEQASKRELPDEYFKILGIVGKYFESNISLKRTEAGTGTMTIRFNSDDEMKKFLEALEHSQL